MERDKYFSSLLYSICEELNSFFSSETQKKIIMSDGKRETVSITTFKKWPFANDFRTETEEGKFSLLYANIVPKWNTMISCERQGLETLKAPP